MTSGWCDVCELLFPVAAFGDVWVWGCCFDPWVVYGIFLEIGFSVWGVLIKRPF